MLRLVDESVEEYCLNHSTPETSIYEELRKETYASMEIPQMLAGQLVGSFLQMMIRSLQATRIVEVGTFTGYSTLVVAMALPDVGKVIACDVSEEWTSVGRRYWEQAGVADKIDLRLQSADRTLEELIAAGESDTFDFAFIDADKNNYDTYYEHCLTLVRTGGVIAIDNVLWGGAVADESRQDEDTMALKALNSKVHDDPRVDINMLPIGDGLTLAVKR